MSSTIWTVLKWTSEIVIPSELKTAKDSAASCWHVLISEMDKRKTTNSVQLTRLKQIALAIQMIHVHKDENVLPVEEQLLNKPSLQIGRSNLSSSLP